MKQYLEQYPDGSNMSRESLEKEYKTVYEIYN